MKTCSVKSVKKMSGEIIYFPDKEKQMVQDASPEGSTQPYSSNQIYHPKEIINEGSKVVESNVEKEYRRKNYIKEYNCWRNMKQRCKTREYVLDPRFEKFSDFLLHMKPMPGEGYSIDRKDPANPEYSPENCRWASKKLQTTNRSNTRNLTDSTGICLPVAEWSRRKGISVTAIHMRLQNGWSEHDAIHRPKGYRLKSSFQRSTSSHTWLENVIRVFTEKLKEVHHQQFIAINSVDRTHLREIVKHLEVGEVPVLPAIGYVLDHWPEFTTFADDKYGCFKPPAVPTISYLHRSIQAIGNYYLPVVENEREAAAMESERHKSEKLLCKESARAKFLIYHLGDSPVCRKLAEERARLNESAGGPPDSALWYENFIDYRSNEVMHYVQLEEERSVERIEQWAEFAMEDQSHSMHGKAWKYLHTRNQNAIYSILKEADLLFRFESEYEVSYQE